MSRMYYYILDEVSGKYRNFIQDIKNCIGTKELECYGVTFVQKVEEGYTLKYLKIKKERTEVMDARQYTLGKLISESYIFFEKNKQTLKNFKKNMKTYKGFVLERENIEKLTKMRKLPVAFNVVLHNSIWVNFTYKKFYYENNLNQLSLVGCKVSKKIQLSLRRCFKYFKLEYFEQSKIFNFCRKNIKNSKCFKFNFDNKNSLTERFSLLDKLVNEDEVNKFSIAGSFSISNNFERSFIRHIVMAQYTYDSKELIVKKAFRKMRLRYF